MPRVVPDPLTSAHLTLELLTAAHASEMAVALADPALYEFTGGEPPTVDQLIARYRTLESRVSPDGSEAWFNWAVRATDDMAIAGYVQATVVASGDHAEVAWVIAPSHQGQGLATEAAGAMLHRLRTQGVQRASAWIHPGHRASQAVARRLGFSPTAEISDREVRWSRAEA